MKIWLNCEYLGFIMLKYDFGWKPRVKIIKNGFKTQKYTKTGWKLHFPAKFFGSRPRLGQLGSVRTREVESGGEGAQGGSVRGEAVRRKGKGSVRGQARTEGTVVNSTFGSDFPSTRGSVRTFLLCMVRFGSPSMPGSVRMNSGFGSAHEQYFRFGPSWIVLSVRFMNSTFGSEGSFP